MRRYSASRGNDYSLPVFCLAPQAELQGPLPIRETQEGSAGEEEVHRPSVPRLQRTASVHLNQLADPEPALSRSGAARNQQRTVTYDRQGNVLLDRSP